MFVSVCCVPMCRFSAEKATQELPKSSQGWDDAMISNWPKSSQGWDDFVTGWDDFSPEDDPVDGRRPCDLTRKPPGRKTLRFQMFLRPSALLPPLSEISHKVPARAIMCVFPLTYQWLAQYYAPDRSHSHIVRVGRPNHRNC